MIKQIILTVISSILIAIGIITIVISITNKISYNKIKKKKAKEDKYEYIQPYDNEAFLNYVSAVKESMKTGEPIPTSIIENMCNENVNNHKKFIHDSLNK